MDTGVILRLLILVAVFILLFLPTVWAIRNIAYRGFPTFKAKVVWFAVVTLLPPIGAFIYIAAGRHRPSMEGDEPEEKGQRTED
ncbi:MAG: hypothetical protein LJE88_08515 [Deltaproteobacteria bacterium]|nr:hypothetical protein [Deltaproteobacteria bacterium]